MRALIIPAILLLCAVAHGDEYSIETAAKAKTHPESKPAAAVVEREQAEEEFPIIEGVELRLKDVEPLEIQGFNMTSLELLIPRGYSLHVLFEVRRNGEHLLPLSKAMAFLAKEEQLVALRAGVFEPAVANPYPAFKIKLIMNNNQHWLDVPGQRPTESMSFGWKPLPDNVPPHLHFDIEAREGKEFQFFGFSQTFSEAKFWKTVIEIAGDEELQEQVKELLNNTPAHGGTWYPSSDHLRIVTEPERLQLLQGVLAGAGIQAEKLGLEQLEVQDIPADQELTYDFHAAFQIRRTTDAEQEIVPAGAAVYAYSVNLWGHRDPIAAARNNE